MSETEPERSDIPTDPEELVPGPHSGQGSQDGGTTEDGGVAVRRAEPEQTDTEKGA